jgi:hypothetical protein
MGTTKAQLMQNVWYKIKEKKKEKTSHVFRQMPKGNVASIVDLAIYFVAHLQELII